jgi:hypothetical protein
MKKDKKIVIGLILVIIALFVSASVVTTFTKETIKKEKAPIEITTTVLDIKHIYLSKYNSSVYYIKADNQTFKAYSSKVSGINQLKIGNEYTFKIDRSNKRYYVITEIIS